MNRALMVRAVTTVTLFLLTSAGLDWSARPAWSDETPSAGVPNGTNPGTPSTTGAADQSKDDGSVSSTSAKGAESAKQGNSAAQPEYAALLKNHTDPINKEGMLPVYQTEDRVYAELSASHYNTEFIVLISIARGIGHRPFLGGMSWGFGDDWVWVFRKVNNRVHVIRKNVRFRADKGPVQLALRNAYSDSVLFSLPIAAKGPRGGDLIDLDQIFMTDLPQISSELPGFMFSPTKSNWSSVKVFESNLELDVAATYASGGQMPIDSVADARGLTMTVHYSISRLPQTDYRPRQADDRIGYFLTVIRDHTKVSDRDNFLRHINRWQLQKANAAAKLSPPRKHITFHIERTVPFEYRSIIREGILEWNKAFQQAGFVDAIEVRQQEDKDTWDPEDIRYNTFRWVTSNDRSAIAMGPSRVNPYTGQILDADIVFDAGFLQFWKEEFETFTPASIARMTGGPLDLQTYERERTDLPRHAAAHGPRCRHQFEMARQLAFGTAAMVAAGNVQSPEKRDELIRQGLKGVVMHEVGHTLGLRHNFKGSTHRKLEDLNNLDQAKQHGMLSSVMDYDPVNIVPSGTTQGYYFTPTIGSYDVWAIQYGYSEFSGSEEEQLGKLAARSGEDGLAFATDEDAEGIDPDPLAVAFDLGKDPIAFAERQARVVNELLPNVVSRMSKEGEDYVLARRAFNVLLATHGQAMANAARFIGGVYTSRSHKGDKGAQPPLMVADVAQQRRALELVLQQIFSDKPFQVPVDVYHHLAPSHWSHWGTDPPLRADFPIHDIIGMWQARVMSQLLSPLVMQRILDNELKVPADQDAITVAELLQRLTTSVFSEVDTIQAGEYTNRKPAVSSLRRALHRELLRRLSDLALGNTLAPEDCRTIAYAELSNLRTRLTAVLDKANKGDGLSLDSYTRAHLVDTSARIDKVLASGISRDRL